MSRDLIAVVREGLHDVLGCTASALEAFVIDKARACGGDVRELERGLIECGCPDGGKTTAFAASVCAAMREEARATSASAREGRKSSTKREDEAAAALARARLASTRSSRARLRPAVLTSPGRQALASAGAASCAQC